jgi:hypothetical protein
MEILIHVGYGKDNPLRLGRWLLRLSGLEATELTEALASESEWAIDQDVCL